MSLAFFALSSLDLLGGLDRISQDEKRDYINWIYEQQLPSGGFRGGPFVGISVSLYMAYLTECS